MLLPCDPVTAVDLIERDLANLTGPEAAGRLSGTDGARRASAYLADALRAQGLRPAGDDDGFFQAVQVGAARLTGPARLTVDGAGFRHRHDFGELTHLSAGGSVRANLAVIRDGDLVSPEALAGKAVLIPRRPADLDLNATAAAVADLGAAALLVEWGEPAWFHKTLFGSAANRIPVLRIREHVAAAMATRPGAPVAIDLPLAVGPLPCRNVLGLLPGTNPAATVALTAHYDHVGDDPGGERFPGAVDNASGVATLLQVVRTVVSGGIRFPFNLLVGFLTGEESGMWGARQLAAQPPVPLSAVINVDGIGFEERLGAVRLGYDRPGNWLADLAAAVFQEHGTEVRWTNGSDDSAAFQAAGLPAVGIGQEATGSGGAAFHTPADTSDVVHLPVIADGAGTIVSLLHRISFVQ